MFLGLFLNNKLLMQCQNYCESPESYLRKTGEAFHAPLHVIPRLPCAIMGYIWVLCASLQKNPRPLCMVVRLIVWKLSYVPALHLVSGKRHNVGNMSVSRSSRIHHGSWCSSPLAADFPPCHDGDKAEMHYAYEKWYTPLLPDTPDYVCTRYALCSSIGFLHHSIPPE